MSTPRAASKKWLVRAIALAGWIPLGAWAEDLQRELLVFGSAELVDSSSGHLHSQQVNEDEVAADVLFSLQRSPWRMLGEYLLSNHEADLERLQFGWQATADTVVWLGRFHQPGSVWNHEHHHGQFLQTAVTRPTIDDWEDDGGIVPQHFTGLFIESNWGSLGRYRLHGAFGGGLAPTLTDEGFEPYDLLRPDHERRRLGYQGRIALSSDETDEAGGTAVGIMFAHDETSAERAFREQHPGLDFIAESIYGAFATYADAQWRFSIVGYRIDAHAELTQGSGPSDKFWAGYVLGERRLPFELAAFARWETSRAAHGSSYLENFPNFAYAREVAGLRWDLPHRQALTLQLSHAEVLHGAFRDVRLQWSGAFF